jgi:hypothetical protein
MREPDAMASRGNRLADSPPYFVPDATGLVLFLCRWPAPGSLTVSLPEDASKSERQALGAALSAWEHAGLGLHFEEALPGEGQIEIAFSGTEPEGMGTGDTIADCAVPADFRQPASGDAVAAKLVHASVRLSRTRLDQLGRSVGLTTAELTGAGLHELGHALGFPGHAARGASVMVREVEVVRAWGARLSEGGKFRDPTLKALYEIRSGAVVGHLSAAPGVRSELQELARTAQRSGWTGPFVRVGERGARLFWRAEGQAVADFHMSDWVAVLRRPERLSTEARVRISTDAKPSGTLD